MSDDLRDRDQAPERTEDMARNGQVWVWLRDTPGPQPRPGDEWPLADPQPWETGRWEVMGTGLIMECAQVVDSMEGARVCGRRDDVQGFFAESVGRRLPTCARCRSFLE